jgi:Xaa-Pro aminopeptidase
VVHQDSLERLRAHAAGEGLAGVLVFSWRRGVLGWFSGYRPGFVTNQAALWVPVAGRAVLAVRFPFEADRASRIDSFDVRPGADPASLPPEGAHIGLVARDLAVDERSVSLVEALDARGISSLDLGGVVDRWRALKSPAEIAEIREAAEIGEAALVAAGTLAEPGETDFEIAARVEAAARRLGSFRVVCLVGIGDGAVVTEATGVVVGAAEPVGLELTIEAGLGCTHVNATLPPQPPRTVDQHADQVCRETRRVLLEAIRPDALVDDVVAAGDAVLEGYGLLAFKEYDFGHGVGVETPEIPRLIPGTGERIEESMTIAVHVALRRPGGETAFVGGPVVVGPDGAEELVPGASWTLEANPPLV